MSSPDEREQAVDELARIVGAGVEAQHSIDQIQRSRLLTQQLAAPCELDVRLLELFHRRRDRRFDGLGAARA